MESTVKLVCRVASLAVTSLEIGHSKLVVDSHSKLGVLCHGVSHFSFTTERKAQIRYVFTVSWPLEHLAEESPLVSDLVFFVCLDSYLKARGLAVEDVPSKLGLFGQNSVDVKQPTLLHHLADRLTNPFVVFNIFNQARALLIAPVASRILCYDRFSFCHHQPVLLL